MSKKVKKYAKICITYVLHGPQNILCFMNTEHSTPSIDLLVVNGSVVILHEYRDTDFECRVVASLNYSAVREEFKYFS